MSPLQAAGNRGVFVRAPAKINLHLRIVGQREDGYHLLEMILVPVTLFDEIVVRRMDADGIRLTIEPEGAGLPDGPENLAWRAAAAFSARIGAPANAHIHLKKRIPVAAGLGGGSSDAAAVLRALNRLLDDPLSPTDLAELALTLGADVPFFLLGRPAIARGIGEVLVPWRLDARPWFLLANPGFPVLTAEVYRNVKPPLTNPEGGTILPPAVRDIAGLRPLLRNDLEPVVFRLHPEVARMREWLEARTALGTRMSGSGPTLFAICGSRADGERLATEVSHQEPGWTTFLVAPTGPDDWAAADT